MCTLLYYKFIRIIIKCEFHNRKNIQIYINCLSFILKNYSGFVLFYFDIFKTDNEINMSLRRE